MKKLMLLGGIRYLLPVIKAAHEQGYYVITADYIPNNIAHKYSDEYVNVSIIDKEAVLKAAKEKSIDGIMSFGVDPGVVTASWVQERLGLPSFGPYESVCILQNKDRFREFLKDNGFNVPKARGYYSTEDAIKDAGNWDYPVIVKPTDSAGSKGVKRVDEVGQMEEAVKHAFDNSISGHIIIENFIEKKGCSSDSDCYSEEGVLKFVSYNAQRFDVKASNPYAPAAFSWPSTYTEEQERYLTSEIQRLLTLLKMQTAVYNIETRIGTDGKPYIMEVSPRGGGNRLCELLHYATGVDLITAITRAAVGDPLIESVEQRNYNGHWAEFVLHSSNDGLFDRLVIRDDLPAEVIEEDIWIEKGDVVKKFDGANNSIGTLVLKFRSSHELEKVITNQDDWFRVIVK